MAKKGAKSSVNAASINSVLNTDVASSRNWHSYSCANIIGPNASFSSAKRSVVGPAIGSAVLLLARSFGYALQFLNLRTVVSFAIFASLLPLSFNGLGRTRGRHDVRPIPTAVHRDLHQ